MTAKKCCNPCDEQWTRDGARARLREAHAVQRLPGSLLPKRQPLRVREAAL